MSSEEWPGLVRVDAWSRYPWLKAGFSTRVGGHSKVYNESGRGELNLGWTESEPAEIVAANRRQFVKEVSGSDEMGLATVRQIHSDILCKVEAGHGILATPEGKAVLEGDGLMTNVPELLLGIQTADCVPVLVADTRLKVVAAFHAGWRGTLKRIVEQGIGRMRQQYGSQHEDLVAAIGPCIGACCFAVGGEVRLEFESLFEYGSKLFTEVYSSEPVNSNAGSQIHLDLVEANRRQLLDAGMADERIRVLGECTACTRLEEGTRKYFSHRAELGLPGEC